MNILEGVSFGVGRRLPMVLQTEAAECGVACLTMLAGYFGHHADLSDLRRRFGLSLKGATLTDIIRVADQIEMATRSVRLEMDELHLLKLPCLVHWDLNHFVVLKSVGRKQLVVHDPAVGIRYISRDEFSKHFTGVAVEVTPTGKFASNAPAPRVRIRDMLGRLVGFKRSLLQLLILAFAIEMFAILSPLFMQWVVDQAIVSADFDLLNVLVFGFLMVMLIRISIQAMRGWMLMVLGASLKVQARTNLFSHLINLPAPFFEARHLGDVMSRFESQDSILQALTTELIESLLDGIMVVFTLVIMILYAPLLAGIVVIGAFLYLLLRWASYTPLRQASAEAIVWSAKRDSHFLESLRGIKTIKLFNSQDRRRSHWLYLLVESVNRQLTTQKLRLFFRTSRSLLIGTLAIIVIWLGALRVMENEMSVGMLLAFISYKDQFLSRTGALIDRLVDLTMLKLHAERLADIALTDREPEDEQPGGVRPISAPVSVEVKGLRFRYSENDPFVLDGIDFKIEAKESVAIIGQSGCGKTTLLKLLAGLMEPTDGVILIDGEPIKRFGLTKYRSMIGVVMQDDQLFAGSIADNICFFADQYDFDRIKECASLAAVHDDIAEMPMGYHTLIGDMGTVLSGGQKQRVLIARALYHKPWFLLLDEATSHLDLGKENSVNTSVKSADITRLIVAHRPETIKSADRAIELSDGKIVRDFALVSDRGVSI
ncbi:Toxin RTX-I translocation ATP-binding protein [Defluviimonas aquaemixtae]|uniref:Toxin RTX-I translocation ATP-binding protein n=1 Tax=Albidovulum aquaemixtae TaxID=1542388 RepID=A0A2R8B401_9RHOB|nr:peptidase domain-containing ABC transporter [Defluviimonas aquaemixtae]SPH17250.1 Toxin RTX-I translocation ATP-binding protein [Defluviimonas aquaemixtae]